VSGPPRRLLDYRRLAQRNLPGLLRYKFLHDYGYDKGAVLVEAIVADICELLRRYYRRDGDLEPGQLIYPAPDRNERAGRGKTMAATRLVPVRLTIVADEDLEAIRVGARAAARREIRVRRLTHEAIAQGALLSERDLGLLTGYSNSAISLTARALRARGEFLPLRGYVADMGSFPTHKAAIIRLYLQGLLTPDIAARTWHSKEARRPLHPRLRARAAAGRQAPPRRAPAAHRHDHEAHRPVPRAPRRALPRRRPGDSPCPVFVSAEWSLRRRGGKPGPPRRVGTVWKERGGLPQRRRGDSVGHEDQVAWPRQDHAGRRRRRRLKRAYLAWPHATSAADPSARSISAEWDQYGIRTTGLGWLRHALSPLRAAGPGAGGGAA
jgi:hypothetical protein